MDLERQDRFLDRPNRSRKCPGRLGQDSARGTSCPTQYSYAIALLSQGQLAFLLGVAQSAVSRIERGNPFEADHLIGLQVIFGRTPADLFPGRHDQIEEAIMRRASGFYREQQSRRSGTAQRRLALLDEMMDRVTPKTA